MQKHPNIIRGKNKPYLPLNLERQRKWNIAGNNSFHTIHNLQKIFHEVHQSVSSALPGPQGLHKTIRLYFPGSIVCAACSKVKRWKRVTRIQGTFFQAMSRTSIGQLPSWKTRKERISRFWSWYSKVDFVQILDRKKFLFLPHIVPCTKEQ